LFEDFLLRTLGSGNPDLLLGKTAEASSAQENGTACFANDAKIFTSWRPKPEEKEPWWKVDLGCPHNVSGVELNWEYDQKEYKYKVEGSSDGCTWILLADRSSNSEKSKSQRLYFDARSVRHLRVTLLGWPEGEAAALVECKAYAQ
ncbi:MAG: discoidin domain-containing protein, partial [bacterium]|nr:discoidin domain-containing protein [bacterium]